MTLKNKKSTEGHEQERGLHINEVVNAPDQVLLQIVSPFL